MAFGDNSHIKTFSHICAFYIGCVALCLVAESVAADESTDVTLTVYPNQVTIPEKKRVKAVILLENKNGNLLKNVQLSAFSNPPFDIQIQPKETRTVPVNGAIAWTASVGAPDLSAPSGGIFFRMDCTRLQSSGSTPIPITRVASLTIAVPTPQSNADIVEVKIETPIESINEKRPGRVYVIVTNKTDVRVTVQPFSARALDNVDVNYLPTDSAGFLEHKVTKARPPWVKLFEYIRTAPNPLAPPPQVSSSPTAPSPSPTAPSPSPTAQPVTIEPYATLAFAFNVSAAGAVTPGKQLLVFDIPLSWEKGGVPQTATIVATHELPVGVFGESAILTAVGLPSFLFLPGFLMIATFKLFRQRDKTGADSAKFDFTWNAGGVVVISITLSIITSFLYPLLTRLTTGVARDYTVAYDVGDVCAVWFSSIVLGSLTYGIVKTYESWRTRQYEFSPSDRPIIVLQKLARKDLKLRLPIPKGDPNTVVLCSMGPALDKSWLSPRISMDWKEGSEPTEEKARDAIDDEDTKRAAELLTGAVDNNQVDLKWSQPNAAGVRVVETSAIQPLGSPERIIAG